MSKNKNRILKRGAIITHKIKKKMGIVIDWGIVVNMKKGFDRGYKELMLPSIDTADSIRVRTSEGVIEIWPTEAVELTRTH